MRSSRRVTRNNTSQYKKIDKRKIIEAKKKCDKIETPQETFDSFNVHWRVEEITETSSKRKITKLVGTEKNIINKQEM